MATLKKVTMFALIMLMAQFVFPPISSAVRVTGDDVPAPTTSPSRTAPAPVKSQEKKDVQTPAKNEAAASPKRTGDASSSSKTSPEAAPVSVPTEKKQTRDARYVTIDFDNVDLQVFIKFVSELTGRNFIIDDKVKGKVTIISPRKISLDEVYKVFESVLEVNGFATVKAGDVTKIVPVSLAREKQLETKVGDEKHDAEDKLVTQIITLENANPDEVKRVLDPLVSRSSLVISYPPTGMLVVIDYFSNIKKVMEIIAALDVEGVAAQISYVPLKMASASEIVKSLGVLFQPQPGRTMTATVRIVADDRANAIILVASEMDSERIKKLIDLMDKDVPKGDAMLRVYRLQNAVAEDLAKVLMNIPKGTSAQIPGQAPVQSPAGRSPLLSRDVQVLADKATNTLIITANKDDYKVLEEVIQSLDVPRPMVFIEALIMEVNANKNFRVGTEWRGMMGTGSISGFDSGQTAAFISSGNSSLIPSTTLSGTTASLGNLPAGFSLGILGAGITIGGVSFPNIGAVLNAYQSDTDVSILSNPQIMTLDNEEAEINVGKNVPFISRQDNTSSSTTGIAYSNYEYKDVGVVLNITPHINEENFVRLKLNQKVSSVYETDAKVSGLTTTLKREAKTVVAIKDRETVVIGGMLGDSTSEGTSKVPCLGDIPLLGWLFKTYTRTREKTNLYVFITPHIIRTQKDAADLYKEKRDSMGEVKEGVIKLKEKAPPPKPSAENAAKPQAAQTAPVKDVKTSETPSNKEKAVEAPKKEQPAVESAPKKAAPASEPAPKVNAAGPAAPDKAQPAK